MYGRARVGFDRHFLWMDDPSPQSMPVSAQFEICNAPQSENTALRWEFWGQFHQYFTCKFFVGKFVQSQTLSREKLPKRLSYEKGARITLVKLTPGTEMKIAIRDRHNERIVI